MSKIFDDCNYNNSVLNVVYNTAALFNNTRCMENISLFFNKVAYELCDDNNNTSSLREQCMQVRDNSCAAEWRIAINILNVPLPNCDNFSKNTSSTIPPLMCPDNYGIFCDSVCLPLCSEVSPLDDGITTATRVWTIFFYTFAIIGGVVTLIACFLNRKNMYVGILIVVNCILCSYINALQYVCTCVYSNACTTYIATCEGNYMCR